MRLEPAAAGTHVVARLEKTLTSSARSHKAVTTLAALAAEEGLVIFPLSRYCLETPQRDGLVLGYGSLTPRQIAASIRKLAHVIGRLPSGSHSERSVVMGSTRVARRAGM